MSSLRRTRWVTGPLALFDLGLGLGAAVRPEIYLSLMHAATGPEEAFLLRRTGVIWLFFAVAEAAAFRWGERRPEAVFLVAMLRWMDVPADALYWATATDLTGFGWIALAFTPVFNLAVGAWLYHAWNRRSA